jgi:paraquat-inducible protein B
VGRVKGFELANTADNVLIYINIEEPFIELIRENTRFWNASGIGVDFKLFRGVKIRTESLESILEGGIAFATPDNESMGSQVSENVVFKLYDKPDEKWLTWKP